MKPRIKFFFLTGAILLVSLWLIIPWAITEWTNRPLQGALSYAPALNQVVEHRLENFKFTWMPGNGGQVTIEDTRSPGKQVWQSLPGRAFISAAAGQEKVSEARGSFFISDTRQNTCANQQIDQIFPQEKAFNLTGRVLCENGEQILYTLSFSRLSSAQLRFTVAVDDLSLSTNRIFLTYRSSESEHFFGFGEQFTFANLKGKRVPVFISEQGIGRGEQPLTFLVDLFAKSGGYAYTSYAAVPYYITTQLRALVLENSEYSVFDLRDPQQVQIEVFSGAVTGRIYSGATPAEILQEYTRYAGLMRPLPDWILDKAVVGMQGGTDKVRQVWAQLQSRQVPIAAFWLQDWVGQRTTSFGKQLWWNWELDETRYPQWEALQGDLSAQNIRVMAYVSPFLADVTAKPGVKRNLFQEAAASGYLVKHADNSPYLIQNTDFSAGMLDFTNPAAVNWMKQVIQTQMIARGFTGWMADFGEALPYDARLSSGSPAATIHNRYPEMWAAVNRAAIEENGLAETGVFFMRAGFTQSPSTATLFWEGDQLTAWDANDGIKSAVTGLVSSGLSGYAFNHSDIGGYTAMNYYGVLKIARSKELLQRWMELSAFTTIYRTHEGNRPDENAQFYSDDASLEQFARFAKVFQALGFYRKTLVAEAAKTGLPIVRHPWLEFPNDPAVYSLSYQQFMFGSELMIGPVLDEKTSQVSVYLPAGQWVHLWSNQVFGSPTQGVTITIPAPLGQPAVFYKSGSAVGTQFVTNLRDQGLLK